MRAIRVESAGGPEVLKLKDVPELKPGPGEVVVLVKAVGVNPVDTYIRSGSYNLKQKYPYTPGFDGAGTIFLIGPDIITTTNLRIGDRVYVSGSLSGTYAEQALCLASQVHHLPPHINFTEGAGINVPYSTAYRALFLKANARPGETVLIHGASGGVGIAAVQLAKAHGLTIIGTASTEKGLQLVTEVGAHFAVDHSMPGYLQEILNITKGHGVNIILEMMANKNLQNDLGILASNGRVVVIGCRGTIEIDPRLLMGNNSSIIGISNLTLTKEDYYLIHSAIVAGLEVKSLRPIVSKVYPLNKANEAHVTIMQPGAMGKIVLIP